MQVKLVTGDTHTGTSMNLADDKLELKDDDDKLLGGWSLADVDVVKLRDSAVGEAGKNDEKSGGARRGVHLIGGKLLGAVRAVDMDGVIVASASLGVVKLPLSAVRAAQLTGDHDMVAPERELDGDVLVLSNGDRVPGTITSVTEESISFSSNLGNMELERSRVTGLLLMAPPGGRAVLKSLAVRVVLLDGSSLLLVGPTGDNDNLQGTLLGGNSIGIPTAQVARLEIVGGRLVALDTLEVIEYEQHSIDLLTWQIMRGRNVLGGPMRLTVIDKQPPVTFDSGLGVHGPCRLVFNLDGRYERLLALAGIDESAGDYADVNIVIRLDGKEALRQDNVKWRQAAHEVRLDVRGVKKMELIVEAGEYFDVQDRVNWADARLLKAAAGQQP